MSHPSRAHLDAIGIPVWVRRRGIRAAGRVDGPGAAATPAVEATPGVGVTPAVEVTPMAEATPAVQALETIDAQVRDCRKCGLHRTRTRTVFGVGRPGAVCMFIGEAPGAEEDAQGEPFVGRAGKLLDAMLAAIGLGRGDVYIANIVKCRPPRNRDPHADEIAVCSAYLRRQIEAVSPRLLVAGRQSGGPVAAVDDEADRTSPRPYVPVRRARPSGGGDVPSRLLPAQSSGEAQGVG